MTGKRTTLRIRGLAPRDDPRFPGFLAEMREAATKMGPGGMIESTVSHDPSCPLANAPAAILGDVGAVARSCRGCRCRPDITMTFTPRVTP